jgi:hypothetical protein
MTGCGSTLVEHLGAAALSPYRHRLRDATWYTSSLVELHHFKAVHSHLHQHVRSTKKQKAAPKVWRVLDVRRLEVVTRTSDHAGSNVPRET